jgi:hypothetical protein
MITNLFKKNINKKHMDPKKTISPIVAMALLLVIAIISLVAFQNWFGTFQSVILTDVENKKDTAVVGGEIVIDTIKGGIIYVRNTDTVNRTIKSVKVNEKDCHSDIVIDPGPEEISVCDCIEDETSSKLSVVMVTDDDVVEKEAYSPPAQTSLSEPLNCSFGINHGENGTFYNITSGPVCYNITRFCNDGVLNGSSSFNYTSCTVTPPAPANCNFGINHGENGTFYNITSGPVCYNITRFCSDGVLNGSSSFNYTSCTITAPPGFCSDDSYYDNVSFYLMAGTNNDSSQYEHSIDFMGSAALSSSKQFNGYDTISLPDGGNGYLRIPNHASFDLATNESFTLEAWYWIGNFYNTIDPGLFELGDFLGYNGYGVLCAGGSDLYSISHPNSYSASSTPIITNEWHHVALTRELDTLRIFINGTLIHTFNSENAISGKNLYLGVAYSTPYLIDDAYVTEFRYTKGIARYTTSFTPSNGLYCD